MLISDVAVSTSKQEGLPVNVMESMVAGLHLVVTDARGNSASVNDGENGYVVGFDNSDDFANLIERLYNDGSRNKFGRISIELI